MNSTASGKFLNRDKVWEFRQKKSEQGLEWSGKAASVRGDLEKSIILAKKRKACFPLVSSTVSGRCKKHSFFFLQKEFRIKEKNFKFNKYNFCCLKVTSHFP